MAQKDSKKQIKKHHLPALPPARRHPQAAGGRADRRAGRQIPDPALGRLGQDQLHRLDRALPGRPARRTAPEAVRYACWWSPTAPCWTASSRKPSSTSSAPPAWWRPSRAKAPARARELAEALSGGKKIVVCTIQTFPFALAAVRELAATQGKRFAVIADEAHSSQTGEAAAKLKAVLSARRIAGAGRWRRDQHRRPAGRADGRTGRRTTRHHLCRLHRHAQGQDAGTVRPRARSDPTRRTGQPAGPVPRLLHAAGHRGRLHPRRAARTTRPTSWRSSWPMTARSSTTRKSSADEAMKGIMRWVRLHPYNISAEGAGGGRALPRERRAAAERTVPRRWWWWAAAWRRCAGSWPSTSTSQDAGLPDRHPGGVLRRSRSIPSPAPIRSPRTSKTMNPNLKGQGHPRSLRQATSIKSCWWPTSFRPASTSRCCAACTWTSGWPASRRCRPSRA
ncbi:MAG: hypothetical protein MZU95_13650 [Desulfomicrobium escambiense]|nr:hypothetical protein [Desulfomicrobium escambiense]